MHGPLRLEKKIMVIGGFAPVPNVQRKAVCCAREMMDASLLLSVHRHCF